MTHDESWDLLKEICNSVNSESFERLKELTENRLTTLQDCHYEAILEGIELTPDFITKEISYLRKLQIALHDKQFNSLRTAMRASLLQTYIDDLDKEKATQSESKVDNVQP